ncbi:MAG TPA: hypothetical protein VGM98_19740 [Schlesneria sp.]
MAVSSTEDTATSTTLRQIAHLISYAILSRQLDSLSCLAKVDGLNRSAVEAIVFWEGAAPAKPLSLVALDRQASQSVILVNRFSGTDFQRSNPSSTTTRDGQFPA